jgi:hypothetical protein
MLQKVKLNQESRSRVLAINATSATKSTIGHKKSPVELGFK